MRVISQELQNTVISDSVIKNVHFSQDGRHWFNVFELESPDEDGEKHLYGDGKFSYRQLIPGLNPDNVKEDIAVGVEATRIVDTMSREEILNAKTKQTGVDVATNIVNATDAQKTQMLGALGLTPEMIAMMNKIASGELVVAPATPVKHPPSTPPAKTSTTPVKP